MTTTRRVAHTASFLQTFHTGRTTADRRAAAGATGSEPQAPEAEAIAFVKGCSPMAREAACLECGDFHKGGASCLPASPAPRAARPVAGYVVTFQGHEVRCGDAFITEAQAKWIVDILTKREVRGAAETFVRLEQGLAKSAGSQFISANKNAPLKPVVTASYAEAVAPTASEEELTAETVPAGSYALRNENGVVKFYRYDRPTQGKWAGYTFLKAQASDDFFPIRNRTEKTRILAEIAKDTLAAEQLYGQELGQCSRCHRKLTDETSRAYGIGPDCRSK